MEDRNFQNVLQSLSNQTLMEFIHSCADDICGRKVQSYTNFKSTTNWSNEEYEKIQIYIKQLLCDAVANNLTKDKLLQDVSELDSSHQQCIMDCLEVRKNDISFALQQKTSTISGPVMQDFDWKLKWIMGSSKFSSLREPLLTVDFHLSEGKQVACDTDLAQTVSLEMDRNELKTMLAALEKAQESITNWQT